MPKVFLNGEYLDRERATLPLDDRGFLFGDGVYEVCRAIRGRIFEFEAHQERLSRGLAALSIADTRVPDATALASIFRRLLEVNDLVGGEATVYLQITRGPAVPRTHAYPSEGTEPTVYATASSFQVPRRLREDGAAAITQPDIRWARCDIKSVNLLPNVMAKQRAAEAGAFEAVFLRDGVVTEGASSNIFGVIDGEVRTFPLCNYILPGVTRAVAMDLATELGITVRENPILAHELPRLQELFATGTATDVQPLVRLDGHLVGDGRPGPVAVALRRALEKRMGTHEG